MQKDKIKLLLVDDHSLMRIGLTSLLNGEEDLTVVGEAENGESAIAEAKRLKPDVIIMDLMLPGVSGAEATATIHSELPDTRILILTSYGTSIELTDAVRNGADGVLLKDAAPQELIDAIHKIATGEKVIPVAIGKQLKESTSAAKLTERQREILASVTRGLSNQDIAQQFGITVPGVKKHLETIFAKIGAANRAEAAAIAMRLQLLKT